MSVRRLVCLSYDALRELSTASDAAGHVMQSAITELFQLFSDVVPFYHRQHISTSPLHAGTSTPCTFTTLHRRVYESDERRMNSLTLQSLYHKVTVSLKTIILDVVVSDRENLVALIRH